MTAQEMWKAFADKTGTRAEYEAWAFGDAPDTLAALVMQGVKTATASAYPLYELEEEPLPEVGEYSVILDSKDEAVCVIKTTRVYVEAFHAVTADHAYKEGEGDRSLDYWRQVHEAFFSRCLAGEGLQFDESMPVVCEEFEVVYPKKDFKE